MAALIVAAVGVSMLIGWTFDFAILKGVIPGKVPMRPNTAISFVLAGIALWLTASELRAGIISSVRKPTVWVCAAIVGLIGIASLAEYLLEIDLKFDSLLFRSALHVESNDPSIGRMAGATALGFVFFSGALLLRDSRRRGQRLLSEVSCLATFILGLIPLIGYIYGAPSLYTLQTYRAMAVHTTLLFCFLGLGSLATLAHGRVLGVVTSGHIGGRMSQRMLPFCNPGPICRRLAGSGGPKQRAVLSTSSPAKSQPPGRDVFA